MANVSSLKNRSSSEYYSLKNKLNTQLEQDIFKLYNEELFSDISVHIEDTCIKAHRCILQTRAPIFYDIYCKNTNLIASVIPQQKLKTFLRDLYKETNVKEKEKELLECVELAFLSARDNQLQDDSGLENSTYYSFSSSSLTTLKEHDSCNDLLKFETLDQPSALASGCRLNNLYYSLVHVDDSLVSSDCEALEETLKDNKNLKSYSYNCYDFNSMEKNTSVPLENISTAVTEGEGNNGLQSKSTDKEVHLGKGRNIENEETAHATNLKVDEYKCGEANNDELRYDDDKCSKFFIDASNLFDDNEISDSLVVSAPCSLNSNYKDTNVCDRKSKSRPNSLDCSECSFEIVNKKTETKVNVKQTPDSLDDCIHAGKNVESIDNSVVQNDFNYLLFDESHKQINKFEETSELNLTHLVLKRLRTILPVSCDDKECNNSNECKKGGINVIEIKHSADILKYYSDYINDGEVFLNDDVKKQLFYKYLQKDESFYCLTSFLEMILNVRCKFIQNDLNIITSILDEYESKLGKSEAREICDKLVIDVCQQFEAKKVEKQKLIQVPDSFNGESETASEKEGGDITAGTRPNRICAVSEVQSKVTEHERSSGPESDGGKSCGFFVDFTESTASSKKSPKKESVPPKQLFSMFIDFGNSTDSDSSNMSTSYPKVKFGKRRQRPAVGRRDECSSTMSLNEMNDKDVATPPPTRALTNVKNSSVDLRDTMSAEDVLLKMDAEVVETQCERGRRSRSAVVSSVRTEYDSTASNDMAKQMTKSENSINIETSTTETDMDDCSYVKLSDLDKEVSTLIERWPRIRMTKSTSETLESKLLLGSANSKSLNRIFPQLSASICSKRNDGGNIVNSIQSSTTISEYGSDTEISKIEAKERNTLGQDLLKMFLNEISPDVTIEVSGRRIKAHKCILASRCQYFAAMLSGGWVESAGNVFPVPGFSYNVVHFALRHIYSGDSEIPESLCLQELASFADMLCLEGLKDVISYTIKIKYCHFFHKPCNICIVGVLECLPIAVHYGLDDLQRKSFKWINKNLVRVWCTKAFSTLSRELIDKCYSQLTVNVTVHNVLETFMNCDKLFSVIPKTRWAHNCFAIAGNLHDFCIKYLAQHFLEFLKSDCFSLVVINQSWGVSFMLEKTQLACNKMRVEELCRCYSYLNQRIKSTSTTEGNDELLDLLSKVKLQIETALVKSAMQASQCSAWFEMESELRNYIQTSAGITFAPNEVRRRNVHLSKSKQKDPSSRSHHSDTQNIKQAIVNRQQKSNTRTVQERIRLAQERRTQQLENIIKKNASKSTKDVPKEIKSTTAKSVQNKYANVKPRYMERKCKSEQSETTPESSEVERCATKRLSKSVSSSMAASPFAKARSASWSRIPVSVRTRRVDSDPTTSGSDSAKASVCDRSRRALTRETGVMQKSAKTTTTATRTKLVSNGCSGKRADRSMSRASDDTRRSSTASSAVFDKRPLSSNGVTGNKRSSTANGVAADKRSSTANGVGIDKQAPVENGIATDKRSPTANGVTTDKRSPIMNESASEEMPKPDIPLRRSGTFCIDEPTVLKKGIPDAE